MAPVVRVEAVGEVLRAQQVPAGQQGQPVVAGRHTVAYGLLHGRPQLRQRRPQRVALHASWSAGANDLAEFEDKAVVGIQSAAGYAEGKPLHASWS
ncbi:hypothetical protein [Streptomyces tritici]|uniref:hypothetical protein n=1 Tax=Streptomyces tritici TaxID=2054410 RepID=UPI003AEFC2DA